MLERSAKLSVVLLAIARRCTAIRSCRAYAGMLVRSALRCRFARCIGVSCVLLSGAALHGFVPWVWVRLGQDRSGRVRQWVRPERSRNRSGGAWCQASHCSSLFVRVSCVYARRGFVCRTMSQSVADSALRGAVLVVVSHGNVLLVSACRRFVASGFAWKFVRSEVAIARQERGVFPGELPWG